jgi:hypothetical protein
MGYPSALGSLLVEAHIGALGEGCKRAVTPKKFAIAGLFAA